MPSTQVGKAVKEVLDIRRRTGERTIVFFDAVMAIAITLLVLEIAIPEAESFGSAQLHELFVPFTALCVSFVALGQLWYLHTQVFANDWMVREVSIPAHLVLMLLIVLFPKTTELISQYPSSLYAVAIYLICYAMLVAVEFGTVFRSSRKAIARLKAWAEKELGGKPDKDVLGKLRSKSEWYDELFTAVGKITRSVVIDIVLATVTTFGAVFALFLNPVFCYVFFIVEIAGSRIIDHRVTGPWAIVTAAWSRLDAQAEETIDEAVDSVRS